MKRIALVGFDKDLLFEVKKIYEIYGYYSLNDKNNGYKWLGSHENICMLPKNVRFLITVDDIYLRNLLLENFKENLASYVSEKSFISDNANIDIGTIIMANSYISENSVIGKCCKINVGSQIHHDVRIENCCVIAPRVTILGGVLIGKNNYIGSGTIIRNGIKIGNNNTIGMGSNVVKSFSDNCLIYGNPAKEREK